MSPFCDAKIVSWTQYDTVECNYVCTHACACINECTPCQRQWKRWESLGSEECDVPCESLWLDTEYHYYCNEPLCVGSMQWHCCNCTVNPIIVAGPQQLFRVCPDSEESGCCGGG